MYKEKPLPRLYDDKRGIKMAESRMWRLPSPTKSSKKENNLDVEQFSQNIY